MREILDSVTAEVKRVINKPPSRPIRLMLFDTASLCNLVQNKIKEECIVGNINEMDASYIGNARQVAKLKQAKKAIEDSLQSIKEKMPIDIVSIDIKAAWHYLGEITGDVANESLINELFSKFCLGK